MKKESAFLTEKMHRHLKPEIHCNAVFSERKTGVTPAALEVTHEAAPIKLEIQYLVLPIAEG